MIANRPTNLWLGLMTAVVGAVSVTLVAAGFDPALVATIGGSWTGVGGAIIAIVAYQPPTLSPGDTFHIQTPGSEPNGVGVVTPPEPVTVDSTAVDTADPSTPIEPDGLA